MNACIKAVFAAILVAFCSIALIAVGQPITNTGGVTTQVVNPSVLPEYLPIGNEQVVLDWIVTNRQWNANAKPLSTFTVISVKYTGTNKIQGARGFGLTDYEFTSYKDFEYCIGKFGMELVEKIINDPKVDHSIPLSMYAYHAYTDVNAETSPMGIYLSKDLGPVRDVSQESFQNFKIFSQVVVRIPNLEKFEVEVDGDEPYSYVWSSQSKNLDTSGPPESMTTKNFVVMQSWYCNGDRKARFKITAGGVAREYTQHGSRVLPPKITMTRAIESSSINIVSVDFTIGTETVVEVSNDLVNWCRPWTIPWDIGTDTVSIPYHTGSGSSGDERVFFRAMSK